MAIIKTMRHDTIYSNAPEYYYDAEENGQVSGFDWDSYIASSDDFYI